MSDEDIRAVAHKRNDQGRDPTFPGRDKLFKQKRKNKKGSILLGDEHFRDKVAEFIDSIPLDPSKLKHCQACEGVLCGLCGRCHEMDRKHWHHSVACPSAQHPQHSEP
jgi:uncharacterized protein with PIN domain